MSIAEIYQLLRNLNMIDGGYLSGRLNAQLHQKKNKTIEFVNYDGLKCEMTEPVIIDKIYDVSIPQTGISVTNAELFLLILLIQEKSNALFRKSKGVKKKFVNGLIRMLIVLVEYKNDDDLLSSLGWRWDSRTEMYEFVSLSNRKGRERQKYYLTRQEFTDRIRAKKS